VVSNVLDSEQNPGAKKKLSRVFKISAT